MFRKEVSGTELKIKISEHDRRYRQCGKENEKGYFQAFKHRRIIEKSGPSCKPE